MHAQKQVDGTRPVSHRNVFFNVLLLLLWVDAFAWFLLQVIISSWDKSFNMTPSPYAPALGYPDSTGYFAAQQLTQPNFMVRILIIPAVTISMVHAEREFTVAAAFVSFTTITVHTLSWILLNLPLTYSVLNAQSWAYNEICSSAVENFVQNNWCHLIQAQAIISCIHFIILFLLWCYSFHQLARNSRMAPLVQWLPLDRLNAFLVVLALIGYAIWAVSSGYLGTRDSGDFNGPLTSGTTLYPYMHTGIFFALVLTAYVCFGTGKRLMGTALVLVMATTFILIPVFIMECRRMYQFRIQASQHIANPPNSAFLAACGPGSNFCDAARASTAGLGIVTGCITTLLVTVWIAYFRAPDDATPAEAAAVPGNQYVGPGYQTAVPNTYKATSLSTPTGQPYVTNAGAPVYANTGYNSNIEAAPAVAV